MTFTYSLTHTFEFAWERVVSAFWLKYPHALLPHMKESLILHRSYDEETGVLTTKRLMCVEQKVPKSIKMLVKSADRYYAIEETRIDANNRVMTLTTRNVSFGRLLTAVSKAKYAPLEGREKEATVYSAEASVTINTLPRLVATRVEHFLGTSSQKNSLLGLQAMEDLCRSTMEAVRSSSSSASASI